MMHLQAVDDQGGGQHTFPVSGQVADILGFTAILFLLQSHSSAVIAQMQPCCCCCAAKSLQSCPTLCDPIEGSPPGSPVPGILQARTLDWVAIFDDP